MPIQFYMRGYNTTTFQYVDWVVNDQPDSTGAYSGYNPGDLTNITINRLVTSKVDNFLKPSTPDYLNINTIDGPYLFHLNSYDWLHPNASPSDPPIPPPTNLIGIAVNRGTTDNNFPEPTPNDYASLVWSEIASSWAFAFIDPLGGLSDTARMLSGSMTIVDTVDSYLQIFNYPSYSTAQSGSIRLPNNTGIFSRDFADSSDYMLIGTDTDDRVVLANSSIDVYLPGSQLIDGSIKETVLGDTINTATTGFIRLKSETTGIVFKKSTSVYDSSIISTDASDILYLGDSLNNGIVYTSGLNHLFKIGGDSIFSANEYGIFFDVDLYSPFISQDDQSVGNGQDLTIKSQSTLDVLGYGGSIVINAGTGAGGDGHIDLQVNGFTKIRSYGASPSPVIDYPENSSLNPDSNVLYNPSLRFYNNLSLAKISFDPIDLAAGTANTFTIAGQDNIGIAGTAGDLEIVAGSGTGINSTGGNLYLISGSGTSDNGIIGFKVSSNNIFSVNEYGIFFNIDLNNPLISQDDQSVGNGQDLIIKSQSTLDVLGYGGSTVINAGTGAGGDGHVDLQVGGLTRLRSYGSTSPAVIDYPENSSLNPDSNVLYNPSLRFYNSLLYATISFDPIDNAFGSSNMLTIAGQDNIGESGTAGDLLIIPGSATGINSTGGNLYLASGTGTDYNGIILFAVNLNPVAVITDDKFISARGIRKNLTSVDSNYNILDSDDLVMVDLSVYAVPITVYLSATPGVGDTYTIKDKAGLSNVNSITVDANGSTIDGSATATLNIAYASITVVYNGSSWSAI